MTLAAAALERNTKTVVVKMHKKKSVNLSKVLTFFFIIKIPKNTV